MIYFHTSKCRRSIGGCIYTNWALEDSIISVSGTEPDNVLSSEKVVVQPIT